VAVEVLVENLGRLFAKVAPFAAGVEEARAENHDGLASALLQLDLEFKRIIKNKRGEEERERGRERERETERERGRERERCRERERKRDREKSALL
jgi:hypothetical protein